MVKIRSPLYSMSASGILRDRICFSNRKTYQLARWQKKQSDRKSTDQLDQRAKFSLALETIESRDFGCSVFGFSLFGIDVEGIKKIVSQKNMTWHNYLLKDILTWQ